MAMSASAARKRIPGTSRKMISDRKALQIRSRARLQDKEILPSEWTAETEAAIWKRGV
jgi:hypothetical protein